MSDEEIVNAALANLASKRADQKEDEYDFFFSAPLETQEQVYQYWIKNKDISTAPTFLKHYAKSRPFLS